MFRTLDAIWHFYNKRGGQNVQGLFALAYRPLPRIFFKNRFMEGGYVPSELLPRSTFAVTPTAFDHDTC